MTQVWTPSKPRWDNPEPRNAAERAALCGFSLDEVERYWESSAAADNHVEFFIANQTQSRADAVRLWEIFRKVTGTDPDVTPQPDGDCVAAAGRDALEILQACEIDRGDREEFREIHPSFHYATSRVLIGKNRLRGGAGSVGGWLATALERYGCLDQSLPGVPRYDKKTSKAWGDDRKAYGRSFRDFMESAADRVVKSTARVRTEDQVADALSNRYPVTIAARFGYRMKPDREGFHRVGTPWNHQMTVLGYSRRRDWWAIKNQWGPRIHGVLIDFDTDEQWPGGFLRVRGNDFERHLGRSEAIAYSDFQGFPEQRFDHSFMG